MVPRGTLTRKESGRPMLRGRALNGLDFTLNSSVLCCGISSLGTFPWLEPPVPITLHLALATGKLC